MRAVTETATPSAATLPPLPAAPVPPQSTPWRRLVAAGALAGVVLVWFAFVYSLGWHNFSSHSDSANAVLAGRDMVGGNVGLHGWVLPGASYWSMDLPLYGLLAKLGGTGPGVIHAAPALIGAATVLLGAAVARAGRRGAGAVVAVGAVFVLLGLPHWFLTYFLFQGPWHVGTALWCLAAVALLRHPLGSPRWWLGTAVLAAAVLGDALAVAAGVVPVAAAGLLEAARRRRWRPARDGVTAAVLATAAALAARFLLDRVGGFVPVPPDFSPVSNWDDNLRTLPHLMGSLLGWTSEGRLAGTYRVVHLTGVVAVAAALGATAIGVVTAVARGDGRGAGDTGGDPGENGSDRWLDTALLCGFLGGVAVYVVAAAPGAGMAGARYLPSALVFGVVVAARRLGQGAERLTVGTFAGRCAANVPLVPNRLWRPARRVAYAGGAAVAAVYLAASLTGLSAVPPAEPEGQLATWLADQGATSGYGSYWASSDVVLQSRGRVIVRPVMAVNGTLHGFHYYAPARWFRANGSHHPRFLVHEPEHPFGGVTAEAAAATFGPPDRVEHFGSYEVLFWNHDLDSRLGQPVRQH